MPIYIYTHIDANEQKVQEATDEGVRPSALTPPLPDPITTMKQWIRTRRFSEMNSLSIEPLYERREDPVDMLDENADGQQNGCGHNI